MRSTDKEIEVVVDDDDLRFRAHRAIALSMSGGEALGSTLGRAGSRRWRRRLTAGPMSVSAAVLAFTATWIWVIWGGSVSAADPLPTVRISASRQASILFDSCVTPTRVEITNGSVTVARTGSTVGPLDVAYRVTSPSPVSGIAVTPPSPLHFVAGQATATITVAPSATFGGLVTIAVDGGSNYTVGIPASVFMGPSMAITSCAAPQSFTSAAQNRSQTIRVGQTPAPFLLGFGSDEVAVVQGGLPPGLQLRRDGTWAGDADTPGTFRMLVVACQACPASTFTLTVRAAGPPSITSGTASPKLAVTGPIGPSDLLALIGLALICAGSVAVATSRRQPATATTTKATPAVRTAAGTRTGRGSNRPRRQPRE